MYVNRRLAFGKDLPDRVRLWFPFGTKYMQWFSDSEKQNETPALVGSCSRRESLQNAQEASTGFRCLGRCYIPMVWAVAHRSHAIHSPFPSPARRSSPSLENNSSPLSHPTPFPAPPMPSLWLSNTTFMTPSPATNSTTSPPRTPVHQPFFRPTFHRLSMPSLVL